MRPIERSEILPLGEYEAIRPHFRARVIEGKRPRRVKVGDDLSAVFENRDSVMLQIQEMLRTERITSEAAILHEIETYNDLLPAPGQLSVTLFVEIPDREKRDRMLVELAGLEDAIALEVDGASFPLVGQERDGSMPERTTAVHYMKCTLSPAAQASLREKKGKAVLVVSHPKLSLRAELSAGALAAIAEDLAASPS